MVESSNSSSRQEVRTSQSGLRTQHIQFHQENLEFLRFWADEGNAVCQWCYGECLHDGIGISKDLKGAAQYFKLSADQGNAKGECQWGICLLTGKILQAVSAVQFDI
jgi:TPR repeat protein